MGGGPKSLKGLILQEFQFFIPTGQGDSAGQGRSENPACSWGFKIHRGFHGWFKGNNILLALPLKNGYKNPSFTRHGLAATLSGTIPNRVGS